jgi:hypothetical protein
MNQTACPHRWLLHVLVVTSAVVATHAAVLFVSGTGGD